MLHVGPKMPSIYINIPWQSIKSPFHSVLGPLQFVTLAIRVESKFDQTIINVNIV